MNYRIMRRNEREICAQIAAKTFESYEYFSVYVPDDTTRAQFLRQMLHTELIANRKDSVVLVAEENGHIAAVAMLCKPSHKKPSDLSYILAGFMKLFKIAGKETVNAWVAMEEQAGAPCHSISDGSTWYLSLLVVSPAVQGKGIGSKMLQDGIIPFVKANGGKLLTLFTNAERNCAFYEKNGFVKFDETSFQYNDKHLGSWSYKREV